MTRTITQFEEQVLRLIHHDFEGRTQREAAKQLKCSQSQISDAVSRLKRKAPQMFPILTRQQAFIQKCICEDGLTHQEIAMLLGLNENTLKSRIARLRNKGVSFEKPKRTFQYGEYMDSKIRHKF